MAKPSGDYTPSIGFALSERKMSDVAAFNSFASSAALSGSLLITPRARRHRRRSNVEDAAVCGERSETCARSHGRASTIPSMSVSSVDRLGQAAAAFSEGGGPRPAHRFHRAPS
jgi:hypothetical protein